jgi:hypothetical protein
VTDTPTAYEFAAVRARPRVSSMEWTTGVLWTRPAEDPVDPCECCGAPVGPVTIIPTDGPTRTELHEDARFRGYYGTEHTPERCRELRGGR